MLARNESGFLSHPPDMCCAMCGITRSAAKFAYRRKCLQYSTGFEVRPAFRFHRFSQHFPASHVTERSGLFLLEGFSLMIALIAHQKWPPFSNLDFSTTSFHHAQSPWASVSALWPRSSLFLTGYKLPLSRGLPDSSVFTCFLNSILIWYNHRTLIIFMDPIQIIAAPKWVLKRIKNLQRNILWWLTGQNSKWALVKWTTVCLPKKYGGASLRDL